MSRLPTPPGLFLRGMAMGIADLVPGVSGGTIAFITGIYETLIASLGAFSSGALRVLAKGQWFEFWRQINGTFLLLVFAGILTSIMLFANLVVWALESQPLILWAYFFGLVLASVFYVAQRIQLANWRNWLLLLLGAMVAYFITQASAVTLTPNYGFIFISGAIAICAMILPGISGSFILVILGMYEFVIRAVKELELAVLTLFALGCVSGLLGFSRLLSYLLRRYHDFTLAVLTGFMAGSLNKIWPWRHQIVGPKGAEEINMWPQRFQQVTGLEPQLLAVLAALLLGITTLLLFNRLGNGRSNS